MQTDNDIPDWRITGDWWDLCNCAIGCPCNFGSDPTFGFCEGVLTWLIREGNYGALKFPKNLAVVLISHWEGNVMNLGFAASVSIWKRGPRYRRGTRCGCRGIRGASVHC
jgi:hypothetical protein